MDVSKHHHKLNDIAETDLCKQRELAEETKRPGEDRIVPLSDGIFAIAVTLLVLDIKLPDTYSNTIQSHNAFIASFTGVFLLYTRSYIVTFIVLAFYWLNHRRLLNIVKRIDEKFLWLNLLFLAFIAFVPVAAGIVKYTYFPEAIIAYTLVLAGCGYSSVLLWIYAIGNHRLIDADRHTHDIIGAIITPTFFLVSLFLLFIPHMPPGNVFYSWLLLLFINRIRRQKIIWFFEKRKDDKKDSISREPEREL